MKIEIKKDKVRIKKEFYTNIHEEKIFFIKFVMIIQVMKHKIF